MKDKEAADNHEDIYGERTPVVKFFKLPCFFCEQNSNFADFRCKKAGTSRYYTKNEGSILYG